MTIWGVGRGPLRDPRPQVGVPARDPYGETALRPEPHREDPDSWVSQGVPTWEGPPRRGVRGGGGAKAMPECQGAPEAGPPGQTGTRPVRGIQRTLAVGLRPLGSARAGTRRALRMQGRLPGAKRPSACCGRAGGVPGADREAGRSGRPGGGSKGARAKRAGPEETPREAPAEPAGWVTSRWAGRDAPRGWRAWRDAPRGAGRRVRWVRRGPSRAAGASNRRAALIAQ